MSECKITQKDSFKIESYLLDREKPNYKISEKVMYAIEKQIPKTPIKDKNILFCPECKVNVPTVSEHNNFCRNCGQALVGIEYVKNEEG